MKDKNHTVFSIDVEKAIDKTQHAFITNILNKLDIEGMYFNKMKTKAKANIIFNGEKLKAFSLNSGNKTRMSTLATFFFFRHFYST